MTEIAAATPGNRRQDSANAVRTMLAKLETILVVLIVLGPVMGVFNPPEGYFWPASFDLSAASTTHEYPITTIITRIVTLTIILLVFRNWRHYLLNIKYSIPILLQITAFAISTIWSQQPYDSLRGGFHLFLYYILSLHICTRYSAADFIDLLTRLFGVSALLSFIVLAVSPDLGHSVGYVGYDSAWRGVFQNKNIAGAMFSLGVLTAANSLLVGATGPRLAFSVLLANLFLLAESRSATSLLTTAVCGLLMFSMYSVRSFVGRLAIVLVALGLALIVLAAVSNAGSMTDLLGRSSTLTGRTDVWRAVIPLIESRPFEGYGLGFWGFDTTEKNNVWLQLGWATPHSHNDFLDVTLQTGLIGASFFILNYLLSLYSGFRRINLSAQGSIFCLIVVIDFIVRGLTETISVFPGSDQILIVYCVQIYLYKLNFSRSSVSPSPQVLGQRPRTREAVT